jgi:hypothetical protein
MTLDASWYLEEAHMERLIATYELVAAVAIIVLGAALLGDRVIHGIRVYFKFRGTRLVTCPETHMTALVAVAAASMGMQAILDEPCPRLSKCSRWPMREGCGQDCLKQVEAHPSGLRFSAACKAS